MSRIWTAEQRRIVRWIVISWLIIVAVMGTGRLLGRWVFVGLRFSPSIAGHLFLVLPGRALHRGELMAFWPPNTPYAPEKMWWMKYVVGMPGDRVEVHQHQVWVAGIYRGRCAQRARQDNRPLRCVCSGVIPADHYFVWGSHPRSFDSRYQEVGLVAVHSVIGRGLRVF